nr:MAG TPA: hypothetical protein [Caudoviricetes sp.]
MKTFLHSNYRDYLGGCFFVAKTAKNRCFYIKRECRRTDTEEKERKHWLLLVSC